MASDDVVGIVMGAGSSSRLGRPKQTLPLGETTLLGRVVADVEASTLDRVVVVLGGAENDVRDGLAVERSIVVSNESYGTGCASSLLAGLDTAGACAGIMLLLGDMPGVGPSIVDPVLATWRESPSWAAVSLYDDGLGHPLVFSAAAFPVLRALHGDKAVWRIVDREPEDRIPRIRVSGSLPRDVDTWDDYVAVCEAFGYRPPPGLIPED